MALRAKPPEAIQKRLKLFMYGPPKIGKTTAAIQFPHSYIIDCERGTENDEYVKRIKASQSQVFNTTNIDEVIEEIRSLIEEKHDFQTLVIDPITPIYHDLLERCEMKVGSNHGRHYGEASKSMRRLVNLVMALDMNVVITCHAKDEYNQKHEKIGTTFDAWNKMGHIFDLIIRINKEGSGSLASRKAIVAGTRIAEFPDGDEFEWSYQEIANRYGQKMLERKAGAVAFASPDQIKEVKHLISESKISEKQIHGWFSMAKVTPGHWEDMKFDVMAKCISYMQKRLMQQAA